MTRVDVTHDHMEFRGADREYEVSTLIFPNGSKAKWPQNCTDFANAMCAGWARAWEKFH